MASRGAFKSFMAWATNKEHGMLTTHFWGPVANWGLVGSAVYDASFQGPEVRSAAYFFNDEIQNDQTKYRSSHFQ